MCFHFVSRSRATSASHPFNRDLCKGDMAVRRLVFYGNDSIVGSDQLTGYIQPAEVPKAGRSNPNSQMSIETLD